MRPSVVVFAYLFAPPIHSIRVADSRDLAAMVVFLVTAVVVGEFAARSRREAREAARLAEEQSALRRVATLVAQAESPQSVFEAVTREVGQLCDADLARMERYEPDGTVTGVAVWGQVPVELAVGTRLDLDGVSIARGVKQAGGPVRVDSFGQDSGAIAREARAVGIRASVGCPIVVAGRLWGVIAASTRREAPFPPDTEARIGRFTELVATAIANAQAREELQGVADEQAALRRVATLVARGSHRTGCLRRWPRRWRCCRRRTPRSCSGLRRTAPRPSSADGAILGCSCRSGCGFGWRARALWCRSCGPVGRRGPPASPARPGRSPTPSGAPAYGSPAAARSW